MSSIPKTRVRGGVVAALFYPAGYRWEVTLDGHPIAEFDNHPDALTYAHRRATTAQRQHVEKLERDAYLARRAAENAADKRHIEFMDSTGQIWTLTA